MGSTFNVDYKSLWVKVEVAKNNFKIIGNIYRPNTAPKARIKQAFPPTILRGAEGAFQKDTQSVLGFN